MMPSWAFDAATILVAAYGAIVGSYGAWRGRQLEFDQKRLDFDQKRSAFEQTAQAQLALYVGMRAAVRGMLMRAESLLSPSLAADQRDAIALVVHQADERIAIIRVAIEGTEELARGAPRLSESDKPTAKIMRGASNQLEEMRTSYAKAGVERVDTDEFIATLENVLRAARL